MKVVSHQAHHGRELESYMQALDNIYLAISQTAGKLEKEQQQKKGLRLDDHRSSRRGTLTCYNGRRRLARLLESSMMDWTIIFLLCLDIILTLLEMLAHDGVFGHNETLEHALHWSSVSILMFFEVELLLLLVAFDTAFFKHIGYVLDLVVVTTSLVLELYFAGLGFLVMIRMWRIIRVVHAFFEAKHKGHEVSHRHHHIVNAKLDPQEDGSELDNLRTRCVKVQHRLNDQAVRMGTAVKMAQRSSIQSSMGLTFSKADPTVVINQTFSVRNLPLEPGRAAALALFIQHPTDPERRWCFAGVTELAAPASVAAAAAAAQATSGAEAGSNKQDSKQSRAQAADDAAVAAAAATAADGICRDSVEWTAAISFYSHSSEPRQLRYAVFAAHSDLIQTEHELGVASLTSTRLAQEHHDGQSVFTLTLPLSEPVDNENENENGDEENNYKNGVERSKLEAANAQLVVTTHIREATIDGWQQHHAKPLPQQASHGHVVDISALSHKYDMQTGEEGSEEIKLPKPKFVHSGVVVLRVAEHGPAAQAGLKKGDIVYRFDGMKVTRELDFQASLLTCDPGHHAELSVYRDNQPITIQVVTRNRTRSPVRISRKLHKRFPSYGHKLSKNRAKKLFHRADRGRLHTLSEEDIERLQDIANRDPHMVMSDQLTAALRHALHVSPTNTLNISDFLSIVEKVNDHRFDTEDPHFDSALAHARTAFEAVDQTKKHYEQDAVRQTREVQLHYLRHNARRTGFRQRLGEALDSVTAQTVIIGLLAVDIVIVMLEVLFLDGAIEETDVTIEIEHALHWTSISILFFFLYEIMATLVWLDFDFFRHPGHVLDLVVVTVSLGLELANLKGSGFLVGLRMWRVFRIVHAVFEAQHKREKTAMPDLMHLHETLKKTLAEVELVLEDIRKEYLRNEQTIERLYEKAGQPYKTGPGGLYLM